LISLPELLIASSILAWYDMNGKSDTSNEFFLALLTASVNIHI